mgnify:CR=1 FL=1
MRRSAGSLAGRAPEVEHPAHPGQEQQVLEFFRKNPQAAENLRAPIFEEKVVDHILGLAKITETPTSKDDLQKAIEALDEEAPAASA